ncbi:FKBP-type peptidyl-prolyl cis-trans isomerase [Chitinophaga sp. SYP-B3965]|uniref:FKBP-type peptidyl-prolyl cis-trans isomerase n=1 Tax=Chitinophaga sp. SYP-B3965 TaxID=2663120 RepID=UPI001566D9AC|nr:FKBP-type peptidyl-prolyl cis-trans isomerase [Chitinophaga sp. SYP-B3965]
MPKAACILQAAFAVFLIGCSQPFQKGEGDMQYKILTDKGGAHIGIDDFVSFSYIEEAEDGRVISSSDDFDARPALMFRERSAFKGDLFAGLGLLSEGDKAVFKINRDSLLHFSGRKKLAAVKGQYIVYRVKIGTVISRGNLSDQLFNNKIEGLRAAEINKARDREADKIADFAAAHDVHEGPANGLRYKVLKQGAGKKALPGDTVEVNYTAGFLSGKVFETTYRLVAEEAEVYNPLLPYKPMALTISGGAALSGFEQAMLMFPKGTEALLVIPSALAYGAQGNGSILPYTPVTCTISISDIKFQRSHD